MDSSQLVRKQTKMEVVHLNQKQLVTRWPLSEACLERWRSECIGPKFMKLKGRVLYRQVDIEAYEESSPGDVVMVSLQGDYSKPRSALIIQSDLLLTMMELRVSRLRQ